MAYTATADVTLSVDVIHEEGAKIIPTDSRISLYLSNFQFKQKDSSLTCMSGIVENVLEGREAHEGKGFLKFELDRKSFYQLTGYQWNGTYEDMQRIKNELVKKRVTLEIKIS